MTEDEAIAKAAASEGKIKVSRDKIATGGWRTRTIGPSIVSYKKYRASAKGQANDRKHARTERAKTYRRIYGRGKKVQEKHRAIRLKRLYGITVAQYDEMFRRQHGLCDICAHPPKNMRLSVDHDHTTGRVRGLLCFLCNHKLIGRRRDPNLFRRVAEYLASDFDGRKL